MVRPLLLIGLLAPLAGRATVPGGVVSSVTVPEAPRAMDYRAASRYSRALGGQALLVVRGDSILYEEYNNGYQGDLPHPLHSGTKSFACALVVAAMDDGLLELDEPLAATLSELRRDSLAARVTVRQLLDLSSGLTVERGPQGSPSFRMQAAPGARWEYDGTVFLLFSELMRRKLDPQGERPRAYLERRVFEPIGMRVGSWRTDAAGDPLFATGAALTAPEWAKFGRLLRDGGRWQGRQVLSAAGLAECMRGSTANPAYGITLWLYPASFAEEHPRVRRAWEGVPRDVVRAAGFGGQRLYVIPSLDLVVVRFADARARPGWSDGEFLARLLGVRRG